MMVSNLLVARTCEFNRHGFVDVDWVRSYFEAFSGTSSDRQAEAAELIERLFAGDHLSKRKGDALLVRRLTDVHTLHILRGALTCDFTSSEEELDFTLAGDALRILEHEAPQKRRPGELSWVHGRDRIEIAPCASAIEEPRA